jgi:GNAT acetyltransferase-like protein
MPLYTNPDFQRLPSGPATLFATRAQDSFFALPAWYDLMTRHGVAPGTEVRLYTNERPDSPVALFLQVSELGAERCLTSLVNAYGVEHGILADSVADLDSALAEIVAEILSERPRWDRLAIAEFDPREPGYGALVGAFRGAGLWVECVFNSGTWYEETAGLDFNGYLAKRPGQLRNTYQRKRRKLEGSGRLRKAFFADTDGIDRAIEDYQTVYAASWKPAEPFPSLIPALIRLAAELGALRLGIYYVEGIPAAAQFWIVWNGRAVIYKLAHDKQFDDLSLGTVLTMEMIERVLLDDRPAEINLGRGDDPYKKLWLPKRRERWGITAANPRTLRGMRLGLRREAAKLYHRMRGEPLSPRPQAAQ